MAFWKVRVELMMNGASGAVVGIDDDDPMCMHTTVSVSVAASNTGCQWPSLSWMEGRPRGTGFSGKVMAKLPLAAHRRISAAARAGSHNGTRVRGMRRPLASPPDQSSIIQSL